MGKTKIPVLLIDNQDSFTFNLVQLLEEANAEVHVFAESMIEKSQLQEYQYIMFSPGPGLPDDFPIMNLILKTLSTITQSIVLLFIT